MGWLRDLMTGASPPYPSYDALARAALVHPLWPTDNQLRVRSLAAVFSKLDRGVDVEWLADRGSVQHVLSQLLSCPVADLGAMLERPGADGRSARRVRWQDVRYARALDLVEERLCPGLPAIVLDPTAWARHWWVAPPGAGRTLAGRWLEARGMATFLSAESWPEVHRRIPRSGASFIELQSGDHFGADVQQLPARLCVAAPGPPEDGCGWSVVHAPPVNQYLDELVDWLATRLPRDTRFDAEVAKQWLRTGAPAQLGMVGELGTALGLCGLLDELGHRRVQRSSVERLARQTFALRIAAWADPSDAAWLKRMGFEVVLGMVRRMLTDCDLPWHAPRPFDAWLKLVPAEHRPGADLAWMRLSLLSENTRVRPADIEQAVRRLPPGAYRVVRALRQAKLLVTSHGSESLALRPLWLAKSLVIEAERSLVDGSAFELGEALLRPHVGPPIFTAIQQRLTAGDSSVLERVLEFEADDSPAQVVAVEAAFVAAGLAVLQGTELPQEQLEAVWNEQLRLAVELPAGLPRPRILCPAAPAQLPSYASWLLAALALSEQLTGGDAARHALLRPWDEPAPPSGLCELLDQVYAAAAAPDTPWANHAFALADRLRSAIGSSGSSSFHPLEGPGAILEELEHEVLSWETLEHVGAEVGMVAALEWMAVQRGLGWPRVAEAVWKCWREAGVGIENARLLAPHAKHADRFWPFAPLGLLRACAADWMRQGICIPYLLLPTESWSLIVEVLSQHRPPVASATALWAAIPAEHVESAAFAVGLDHAASLLVLWERTPERMLGLLERGLDHGRLQFALAVLDATPPAQTAAVLPSLQARVADAPAGLYHALRTWLVTCVAQRGPRWRSAYSLLAAVERDLRRFRH